MALSRQIQGSQIESLDSGTAFPGTPNTGQEFFLTADIATHLRGSYVYDGVAWSSTPLSSTGTNYGWNDLLFPGLTIVAGASAPDWAVLRDGINAYAYDAANPEQAWGSIHLLHDYVPGTDLYPHVHWTHNNVTPTGAVRWGLEYTIARGYEIDTFPASTTITIDVTAGAQYAHHIEEFASVSGTGLVADTIMLFRIFREAGNAADTFGTDAFLLHMDVHYQSDGRLTPERTQPFTKYT